MATAVGIRDVAERAPFIGGQRVPRGRRRGAARRRRAGLRLAGGVLLLVLLGAAAVGAVHWLRTTPWLAVSRIEVLGTSRLAAEDVLSAAAIPPGANLLALDPAALAARIEGRLPVRRAQVVRALPDRVSLLVEERVPFALIQAGRLYWVDEEGVALWPESRAVTPRLPVITGVAAAELAGAAPPAATRAGLSLIRSMLRTGSALSREISEIDLSRADGPVLYTLEGIEVRLGGTDWEERLGRLEGVLAQLRALGEPVEYVDLRFRGQVVFKPRSG
jgi:cell division septal protein FtsQ